MMTLDLTNHRYPRVHAEMYDWPFDGDLRTANTALLVIDMREANDRGYECLLLEDCCAAINPASHAMSVWQVRVGAIFGVVAKSVELMEAIQ